jgi:hypothetical protein
LDARETIAAANGSSVFGTARQSVGPSNIIPATDRNYSGVSAPFGPHPFHVRRQLMPIDLDGTSRDRQCALRLRDIKMRETGGRRRLKPFALDAYRVCHSQQFIEGIGDHVAHLHAPVDILRTIDVHAHDFTSPSSGRHSVTLPHSV